MKYTMDYGQVVDTDRAVECWQESERWNGQNHISRATGTQWEHETLFKSTKGNYWIEHVSQWQGSTPHAFFLTAEEAARWLLTNEHELPADLVEVGANISE